MKGLLLSLLPLLAAGSPVLVDTIHNDAAPIISSSNFKEIPDSYMVVFKKHVTERGASVHHSWVQDTHSSQENRKHELRKRSQISMADDTVFEGLRHTYNIPGAGGFLGYAGHFDEGVIELVRRHPDVSTRPCFTTPLLQISWQQVLNIMATIYNACLTSILMDSTLFSLIFIANGIFGSSRAYSLRLNSSSVTRKSAP